MRTCPAYTLIEVLIVVVIVAILAGISVSQGIDATECVRESAAKHDLGVIRTAIQFYRVSNDGVLPGQDKKDATFKAELASYLRTHFPENPFDQNQHHADSVKFRHQGDPLVDHVAGDHGWLYDNSTGEFIANTDTISSDGVTKYSEF